MLKVAIVLLLLATLVSLFSGLFFLVKDQGHGSRVVNSLTVRRGARRGDPGAGRLGLLQRRAEQPRALAFLIPPVAVRSRRRR